MVATTLGEARVGARRFYVAMAAIFFAIAVGGFAATYWLQLLGGTFVGPPLLHLHAFLFTGWTLLLLSQAWRASQGRMDSHRAWGVAGVALATAMVFTGVAAAGESLAHGIASGWGDRSRAFLIVPLSAIVLFAGFFAAALANVGRPEWHKRFMLVATASLIEAAVARIPFLITSGGGPGLRPGLVPPPALTLPIAGAVAVSLILAVGMAYDWRTRGRPHPAYLIGVGALLVVAVARVPLATTPGWFAVADFLNGFARPT